MRHCSDCGGNILYLGGGGCGGRGQRVACESCLSVFVQVSGGIVATPGGERWQKERDKASQAEIDEKKKEYEKFNK